MKGNLSGKILIFGNFAIDMSQSSVVHVASGKAAYLGSIRARILLYLCTNINKAVSRDAISMHIWGYRIAEHNLNQHISQLRKKMASFTPLGLTLETVPKRGYIAKTAVAKKNTKRESITILVVESEEHLRIEMTTLLTNIDNVYVKSVAKESEAEHILALQQFDLAIINSTLTGENAGINLIKRIRTSQTPARAGMPILSSQTSTCRTLFGINSLLDTQGTLLKPLSDNDLKDVLLQTKNSNFKLKPTFAYELVPTFSGN